MSFKEDYNFYRQWHGRFHAFSLAMPMWWFIVAGCVAGIIYGIVL